MARSGRIASIDFWRGVALITIFVDHVPNTPAGQLTQRNFGFSDAAEAFIFLSGLVLAYVCWPKIENGQLMAVVQRCLRRAGQLYLVQVALSVAAVALFWAAFMAGGGERMLEADNRAFFFDHPGHGLLGLALLSYQFGYFNILSVYVVLMLIAAGMFALMARNIAAALGVSLALYIAARLGLSLPSWPLPYTWFLNPFAWQFLFTLGMVTGVALRGTGVPYVRPLFWASALYLVFALLVTTDGFGLTPDLGKAVSPWLDSDKGVLGVARLAHFLALAYVISQIRLGDLLLRVPGLPAVAEVGRQSLSIFVAGSLLSAVGQIVLAFVPSHKQNPLAFDAAGVATVATGATLLFGLARFLTWRQTLAAQQPKPTPVPETLPAHAVASQPLSSPQA